MINSEVKNLHLEVTALRLTINDWVQNDKETQMNTSGSKLPKGLSTRLFVSIKDNHSLYGTWAGFKAIMPVD